MKEENKNTPLSEYNKNKIVQAALNVEYYPSFDKKKLSKEYLQLPISEIASVGVGFSSLLPTFRTMITTVDSSGEGLYRCVFPNGVTGSLAQFKDGSGALGTIINSNGIAGQARWIKASTAPVTTSVTIPYNPTVLFMSVALMNIERKLDGIQKTQQEIIGILERDKKAQLLADMKFLSEISKEYKYYWNNETMITVYFNQIQNIKRNAQQQINSNIENIENDLEKKQSFSSDFKASIKMDKIVMPFIQYKMAVYTYSFSRFIEVMLTKNFNSDYLHKVVEELRENAYQYRILYTKCYEYMEDNMNRSIGRQIKGGIIQFSKKAGKTISKVPLIGKTQIDESLITSGEKLEQKESDKMEETMELFRKHKESGISLFINNIDTIDGIYNQDIEVLMDQKNLYINLGNVKDN